jgi:hypothetical protein
MKAGTAILFSSTTASLRESIVCYIGASILACNIVAVLLIRAGANNGLC